MSPATRLQDSRTAATENFPVGSRLLPRALRPAVASFYRFARAADDIADNPLLDPTAKLELLDAMDRNLTGDAADTSSAAMARAAELRAVCLERGLSLDNARHLLIAFRADAANRPCRALERPARLLPLFGDAGRAVPARTPRRGPRDLPCIRCAVHRAPGAQPHPGLPGGLPQPASRLCADRLAGRARAHAARLAGASARRPNFARCSTACSTASTGSTKRRRRCRARSRSAACAWRRPASSKFRGALPPSSAGGSPRRRVALTRFEKLRAVAAGAARGWRRP